MTSSSTAITADWLDDLHDAGAVLDAARVLHFGHPDAELAALTASPTLHPLADWSILRAAGADVETFLNGQLSNDVGMLDARHAQLSTYCTAQGRMLATLMVWREGNEFLLQLPAELAGGIRARLQRYVLRAAVTLADTAPSLRILGLGGPGAAAALAELVAPPAATMELARGDDVVAIRLHGPELFNVVVPAGRWRSVWNRLAARARPAGTDGWRWRLITAGLPVVTAATQEQFVPQMANLEQLGAVSFTKGCYPGQEIIARAQYRGEVKRRLFRLHAAVAPIAGQPILAGQPIFPPDADVAAGTVLDVARAPEGGFDLLAVLSTATPAGELRVGGPDGAVLHVHS